MQSSRTYYNEFDPYCAQWLRNLITEGLIPDGDVDDRDIREVRPEDLCDYTSAHFFAGIGGWAHALRLAGWPDDKPVWTGSCPCQPFSLAGRKHGFDDERHLWPSWFNLIRECQPAIVFGEQVASAKVWLDQVFTDLEGEGYACGAAVLPACSVDAPHRRDRFWFVADARGQQQGARASIERPIAAGLPSPAVADTDSAGLTHSERSGEDAWLDRNGASRDGSGSSRANHDWSVEPAVGRVAHGVPARVAKLRAFGNAIVPQVAAEFIKAAA